MRILHVTQLYWPFTGGSERYLSAIAERQVLAGHEVTVLTTDAFDLELFWSRWARRIDVDHDTHNGVRIVRLPVRHLPVSEFAFPAVRYLTWGLSQLPAVPIAALRALGTTTPYVPALRRALRGRAFDADLIHGINICFEGVLEPAQDLARRSGVPFVLTPLTHLAERAGDAVSRYYTMRHQIELSRTADAVFAMTGIERDYLASRGVDAGRIHVAGVGVDPDAVTGGSPRRFVDTFGVEPPFVFYVGTAAFDKGTVHVVEAMRRLWARGEVTPLVIAGPTLRAFRDYVDHLPVADHERVHLLGVISEADKRDLFAAGTVFAMPSRTDSFGIVFLEAWLNDVPVIGARAGGVPAVIEHGNDGYLVRFGDVEDLAGRIAELLADRNLRWRFGHSGHAKTMTRYTWDAIYPTIEAVCSALPAGLPARA